MPHRKKYSSTNKSAGSRFKFVFAAATVCLVAVTPCFARHNRVTVTTYGDAAGTAARAAVTETYFDGLGRQTLSVARGAGGSGEDVWTRTDYDRRGNVWRQWSPTPVAASAPLTTPPSAQALESAAEAFYGREQFPYTRTEYELWTTNRPEYVYGPGATWQSHPSRTEYGTNNSTGDRAVRILLAEGGRLKAVGMYRPGTLRRQVDTDADGTSVTVFTDRLGRKICERRKAADGAQTTETRFVYDIRGDLRYVVSPEGFALIEAEEEGYAPANAVLYCDRYDYDIWHRVVSRTPAGCEAMEYVYDRMGRVVMWRDAALRSAGRWHVTKYDDSMRRAVEGSAPCRQTRETLQALYGDSLFVERFVADYNKAESSLQYTENCGPVGFEAVQAWYYDDYTFATGHIPYASAPAVEGLCGGADAPLHTSAGCLCTGMARKLDGDTWYTVTRYDDYARPAWTCNYDLYGQNTRRTTRIAHDFRGRVTACAERLETIMECTPTEGHTAVWNYAYDLAGRRTSVTLAVDGGSARTVATYTYDGVGRLASKSFGTVDGGIPGGTSNGTSVEYVYDVRSNVTTVSGSGFAQTVYFGTNPVEGGASRYLSPCAASERQYGAEGEGVLQTMWTYRYDGFGRLAEASATDAVSAPDRALGEVFEYDRNSNILSLERVYAGDPVQDAAMSYVGNRLTGVNDASMPYNKDIVPSFAAGTYALEYDGDGRLVTDGTRGITAIKYTTDGTGLPTRIDLGADNKVYSSYLPDGTLMSRQFYSVRTRTTVRVNSKGDTIVRTIREPVIDRTLYRGDWEISGSVWRLNTPEGIATVAKGATDADAGRTFTHLWYVRDRLGSVRTVVDDNGTIRQCTMYYPSGLPVQLFGTERVTDRAHIGNRWSNFAGLGWHDNIARWHDAILGRFTTPDPKSADYPSFSPYTHCAANPLRFTDPTGMDIYIVDRWGNVTDSVQTDYADVIKVEGKDELVNFEYGTIESLKTLNWISDGPWDVLSIRGDQNGTRAFEYLAKNTEVEWTQLMLGQEGDQGLNILSTSHSKTEDRSGPNLVFLQYQHGYTVRQDIHSHPNNSQPSGIGDDGIVRNENDIAHALSHWNLSLLMKKRIKHKVYKPGLNVYEEYYPYFFYRNKPGYIVK